MRFEVSYDNIAGHGLIVRLPLGFGISFWGFHWWSWMIGCSLGDDGFLEWHLGPFAGEMWREDLTMLKMTPSEYELKVHRESELYLAQHKAEKAVFQMARQLQANAYPVCEGEHLTSYDYKLSDWKALHAALAEMDAIDAELDALDRE